MGGTQSQIMLAKDLAKDTSKKDSRRPRTFGKALKMKVTEQTNKSLNTSPALAT